MLGFTAWSSCNADCGSGFLEREAFCSDPSGNLAALSACTDYSGEHAGTFVALTLSGRADMLPLIRSLDWTGRMFTAFLA